MEYFKFRFDHENLAERFISKSVLSASKKNPFVSSIKIVNFVENCVMVEITHSDVYAYLLNLVQEHQGQQV